MLASLAGVWAWTVHARPDRWKRHGLNRGGSSCGCVSRASGPGEVGLALLGEGARALLGVVGGEHPRADDGIVLPAVVLVLALGVTDGLEHGLHRERTVGSDLVGELVRLRQRLTIGY